MEQSPVFNVGNARPGTTIFCLVMVAHRKIDIPSELEFIV